MLTVALATGRHVVIEGPPGTGKSTLLRSIAGETGQDVVFVEGNAELTPARLVGQFDPSQVLADGLPAGDVRGRPAAHRDARRRAALPRGAQPGPRGDAQRPDHRAHRGRDRGAPARHGAGRPDFRLIAAMNPFDAVGTARVSQAIADRMCRVVLGYQDEPAERAITAAVSGLDRRGTSSSSVALTRATREHRDVRMGSSVRGAIDLALLLDRAGRAARRGARRRRETARDAAYAALSGRIRIADGVDRTPGVGDRRAAGRAVAGRRAEPTEPDDDAQPADGQGKADRLPSPVGRLPSPASRPGREHVRRAPRAGPQLAARHAGVRRGLARARRARRGGVRRAAGRGTRTRRPRCWPTWPWPPTRSCGRRPAGWPAGCSCGWAGSGRPGPAAPGGWARPARWRATSTSTARWTAGARAVRPARRRATWSPAPGPRTGGRSACSWTSPGSMEGLAVALAAVAAAGVVLANEHGPPALEPSVLAFGAGVRVLQAAGRAPAAGGAARRSWSALRGHGITDLAAGLRGGRGAAGRGGRRRAGGGAALATACTPRATTRPSALGGIDRLHVLVPLGRRGGRGGRGRARRPRRRPGADGAPAGRDRPGADPDPRAEGPRLAARVTLTAPDRRRVSLLRRDSDSARWGQRSGRGHHRLLPRPSRRRVDRHRRARWRGRPRPGTGSCSSSPPAVSWANPCPGVLGRRRAAGAAPLRRVLRVGGARSAPSAWSSSASPTPG